MRSKLELAKDLRLPIYPGVQQVWTMTAYLTPPPREQGLDAIQGLTR